MADGSSWRLIVVSCHISNVINFSALALLWLWENIWNSDRNQNHTRKTGKKFICYQWQWRKQFSKHWKVMNECRKKTIQLILIKKKNKKKTKNRKRNSVDDVRQHKLVPCGRATQGRNRIKAAAIASFTALVPWVLCLRW